MKAFKIILFTCLLLISSQVNAQKQHARIFVGLQPYAEVESFYDDAFDINVFPVMGEITLGRHFTLRLTPKLNLQIVDGTNEYSQAGIQIILPYYFEQIVIDMPPRGFYAGPLLDFSHSILVYSFNTYTLGAEAGYRFLFDRWSISTGLQGGAFYLADDIPVNDNIYGHYALKIGLGIWL